MKKFTLKSRRLNIGSKISLIILWAVLARFVGNELIIPRPGSSLIRMLEIIKGADFLKIIGSSLTRTVLGFFISLGLALGLGILSTRSRLVYNFLEPLVDFLRSVPTIAIIILALIWMKAEMVAIFVGFIMVFPIIYEAVVNSILDVDEGLMDMARLYGVGEMTIIRTIYLPSIAHGLSSILNSVLGINLKMVIAGEVLAQPSYAIGSQLQLQRIYLNTDAVFAWILIILLISQVFDLLASYLSKRLKRERWEG